MNSEDVDAKHAKGKGWKHVYDTLRMEILALTLAPGQLLDETSLAERFGLSRSPVREAASANSGIRKVPYPIGSGRIASEAASRASS